MGMGETEPVTETVTETGTETDTRLIAAVDANTHLRTGCAGKFYTSFGPVKESAILTRGNGGC
eukprot:COSAG03_NODE_4152_length_1661_cov_125.020487_2_plen_63_part_00